MLKIVGDINFTDGFFDTGFGIGSNIKKGNDPFKWLVRKKEDVWLGNLECVISDVSNKSGVYKKQFRIPPYYLENINHFNIYSVANNHVMQHGDEAYDEMLNYIKSKGLDFVGTNDRKTIKFTHQEKYIGILAFSQREEKYSSSPLYWYNPEYSEIETEFLKLKNLDFKIAYVHWGNEFINRPYIDQKKFAHWLIDLGFDIIIGVHSHVLQGFEIYKGRYVFYSLGNFLFNMPLEATRYSIVLSLDFSKNYIELSYDYVYIGQDNFPRVIKNKEIPRSFDFKHLNEELKIETENEIYYGLVFSLINKYRLCNYKKLIKSLCKFNILDLRDIFVDFFKRRLKI